MARPQPGLPTVSARAIDSFAPSTTRISVELVPRTGESLHTDVVAVRDHLLDVDTINVPDLPRFPLRSWDACALARQVPRDDAPPYAAVPHLRAESVMDAASAASLTRAVDESGIEEVLVITGDPRAEADPRDESTAVAAIAQLRRDLPHLSVYACLDPYRQSMIAEVEYVERKIEAGAAGVFTQPFFDADLMSAWGAVLPPELPVWWGATTVTTGSSMGYWVKRNRVVFPADFEPTLEHQRDLAARTVKFARERGQHVYLMPVAVDVLDYLHGVV